jgi:RNA polymerase sigma factor (sigma-70 family)
MADYADIDLLNDFISGEEKAFKEVYKRFYPKLYLSCYRIIRYKGNQEDAKDIVSITLNKLFSRHKDFKSLPAISSFLFQVARNSCIDFLRQRRGSRELSVDPSGIQAINDELDADFLDRVLQEEKVLALVKELPPRSREVIVLYYLQGLKYKDIAGMMGISPRTVENQLRFALDRLRNALIDKKLVIFLLLLGAACLRMIDRLSS